MPTTIPTEPPAPRGRTSPVFYAPRRLGAPLIALAVAVGLAGCTKGSDLDDVRPVIIGEPGPDTSEGAALLPGFACNAQLDTWVEIHGSNFSPLVIDAIDDDRPARVFFPSVTLIRSGVLPNEVEGPEVSVELHADNTAQTPIRWLDEQTLRFRVSEELDLPPGIYDVMVTNAFSMSAVEPEAFGIIPPPMVAMFEEEALCDGQGTRGGVVFGDYFLARDDALPTVVIGDLEVVADAAEGCRDLPIAGDGYRLCTELHVTLPADQIPDGPQMIGVVNATPVDPDGHIEGCRSAIGEDAVTVHFGGPMSPGCP